MELQISHTRGTNAVARELFMDRGGQKREHQKERVFVKFGPRFLFQKTVFYKKVFAEFGPRILSQKIVFS